MCVCLHIGYGNFTPVLCYKLPRGDNRHRRAPSGKVNVCRCKVSFPSDEENVFNASIFHHPNGKMRAVHARNSGNGGAFKSIKKTTVAALLGVYFPFIMHTEICNLSGGCIDLIN